MAEDATPAGPPAGPSASPPESREESRDAALKRAAAHWDATLQKPVRRNWYHFVPIRRHVNRLIDATPSAGVNDGFFRLIAAHAAALPLGRGVSVGAGAGGKEIALVERGMVGRFDLFEISPARIARGRADAAAKGLADRVAFHEADAFAPAQAALHGEGYDLVFWHSSLHHMLDVEEAVRWSRAHLRPGGLMAVNEYVGPNRWQHSRLVVEVGSAWRASLDAALLADPRRPGRAVSRRLQVRPPERMIAMDPTEAADSEAILPSLARHFPEATVIPLGGTVYQFAMVDVVANLDPERDREAIERALGLDDAMREAGYSTMAVAVATRP